MAYNTKYQQKAYIIIMCIKIDVNILCHCLWNDLTNSILLKCVASSIRPACNLLAYTGYPDLYFCMSLERSMSCSDGLACVPTDRPR